MNAGKRCPADTYRINMALALGDAWKPILQGLGQLRDPSLFKGLGLETNFCEADLCGEIGQGAVQQQDDRAQRFFSIGYRNGARGSIIARSCYLL
jgi:hypothetical protein